MTKETGIYLRSRGQFASFAQVILTRIEEGGDGSSCPQSDDRSDRGAYCHTIMGAFS